MAPTPVEDEISSPQPSTTAAPEPQYWTKANIATTIVFALLALAIFLVLLIFYLRKRAEKKKHHKQRSDRAGLLDNEDKSSMFSRERHSSVTLYLDSDNDEQKHRASQEITSLMPLQVTPLDEVHDPMNYTTRSAPGNNTTTSSTGSGISSISRLSSNTTSTVMLSPLTPSGSDGDLGVRPSGRPRSVSSTSQRARYYESTPTDIEMPQIPTIIRTGSGQ